MADCPGAVYNLTYTATDDCSRAVSCTQVLTIANAAPTITCPANAFVDCASSIVVGTPMVTASCTLGTAVSTMGPTLASGTADCPGATYTIVYTVTDGCSRTASCTQTLTIANAVPTITCPANGTVDCAANIVAGMATASTSCTLGSTTATAAPVLTSGTADCPGAVYSVVYSVTDACGRSASCTQTFTIVNAGPTITCPPNMNAACLASIVPGTPNVTVSCSLTSSVTTVGPTLVSGTAGAPGSVYSIVYTVTDACGRTASCTQLFTISNAAPTISCPANQIVACTTDISVGTPTTSSSNCATPGVVSFVGPSLISGIVDCPGAIYHIVYTVTDEFSRTASCTQVFTIANAAPTITCPAAAVVDCSANIVPGTPAVATSCTLTSTTTVTAAVLAMGTADCPGATYNVVYTVTDACSRTASCTQVFTICLLYTSPSPRDATLSRMPSSA